MKKIIYLLATIFFLIGCSDDFLNRYPKGQWHHGNYTPDNEIDNAVLSEAKMQQIYGHLRSWGFCWPAMGMHNFTTPDAVKGSTPNDGGEQTQFKAMSYTASNDVIRDYYTNGYQGIFLANEALALIRAIPDTDPKKNGMLAEALFMRSLFYYRLVQAFGGVSYVDRVLGQTDKTPARSTAEQIYAHLERDLTWSIPNLPTRKQLEMSRNQGRITQNGARALLAKVYLYQQKWDSALGMTSAIIASGDNDLSTPYAAIFTEKQEFGSESILEVFVDHKPDEKIFMTSQYAQVQGLRGTPNLGWGFNGPSEALMNAYEPGDPRKVATVIGDGDVIDGDILKADPSAYLFFNKKLYPHKAERGIYGRSAMEQGTWINIRLIRYADVLLMHAEAANEVGNTGEALDKLEMVRARARGGNASVLPPITDKTYEVLRDKIRQERRIELALEFERFFDLVRWGIAKDLIPGFVTGKHELFPIPQTEIDKSEGVIVQNPSYN